MNNPELVKQKRKGEYERNKHKYVERNKQYREEHKDMLKEYSKIYREIHKDRLVKYEKAKYTCSVCGSCIRKKEKPSHEKTKKHLQALEATTVDT